MGAFLRSRRVLLVIDNFEHLVTAAPVVTRLLEASQELTALVTSRELLRVSGNGSCTCSRCPSRPTPVELFGERAANAGHPLGSLERASPVVPEICRRLEGVPLAIELAAPRLRVLTPEQLLERLSSRVSLQGPRGRPRRGSALSRRRSRGATSSSAHEEQRLFRCLGVFPGSFTIEAAEAVGGRARRRRPARLPGRQEHRLPGASPRRDALRAVAHDPRVRQSRAWRRPASSRAPCERFGAHYRELALGAEEGLRTAAQRQWKQTLDAEADNVRAALALAADGDRSADLALLLRGFFLWFWLHGNLDEIRHWASRGLAIEGVLARDRGWLLHLDGTFGMLQGDFAAAADQLPAAEALLVEAGDEWGVAMVRLVLAYASAPFTGEAHAHAKLGDALAALEQLGDLWGVTTVRHMMCRLRVIYGRFDDAGDVIRTRAGRRRAAWRRARHRTELDQPRLRSPCRRLVRGGTSRSSAARSTTCAKPASCMRAPTCSTCSRQIEHMDGRHRPGDRAAGRCRRAESAAPQPDLGPRCRASCSGCWTTSARFSEKTSFAELYARGQALAPGDAEELACAHRRRAARQRRLAH